VTTPPSKGLVVELYLIYFGLAQSFVDDSSIEWCKTIITYFGIAPATVASKQPKAISINKHTSASIVIS
jgi:hypothetical protein